MRWILPGFATVLLLAQGSTPVKTTTPEQLQKEITKLQNNLNRLRELNRLKDAFEAAKCALAEQLLPLKERKKLAEKRARKEKRAAKDKLTDAYKVTRRMLDNERRIRNLSKDLDAYEAERRTLLGRRGRSGISSVMAETKLMNLNARISQKKKQIGNLKDELVAMEQPKKLGVRWVFVPDPMPTLSVGEAKVLRDVKGIWWVVKRDTWNRIGLNEFGPTEEDKTAAMQWIRTIRADGFIK